MLTDKKPQFCSPEIWGGIECTINRVGDQFFDQLEYSGHYNRREDLHAFADLGIKKLRYPLLWEFHQKSLDRPIDWSFSEKALNRLYDDDIEPIVTLLHHGSGPAFTNMLDDHFPELLASYAGEAAKKFPWITYYTPVNEPLTTARFSGLYGFWYPHKSNDVSFIKMLLNELKAIVLSMREIRKINPAAQLVQTEDLGKTYSTEELAYQATFENHRRWLTYDLLTGNIDSDHPMWQYFTRLGIKENEMQFFKDNPCPPDIMGMNYYVTSERYLDHEIHKYEKHTHGSNELQTYADVEAVRVPHQHETGLKLLMKEAWHRYHIPLAITEAHLNCTREEQLRWLNEKYHDCCELTNEGVDIKGFTIWSLLGAFGWNKLLTTEHKDYETGAFDVRSGKARPTALAHLIQCLSKNNKYTHPVIEVPGWWKRNVRFLNSFGIKDATMKELNIAAAPVLILGKNGTLGKAFARACSFRKIHYLLLSRQQVDITDPAQIALAIQKYKPWGIINAAGFVRVDDAETEKDKCFLENGIAVKHLAVECSKANIQLMTFSSDLVFNGNKGRPYTEEDMVDPLNVYGESKVLGEQLAFAEYPETLIIRSSAFFSPFDTYNFVSDVINNLSSGINYKAPYDYFVSPTYVPDLVNAALDLFLDKEKDIWHLSCGESWSWAALAGKVADLAGLNKRLLEEIAGEETSWVAKRPFYSVLGTRKGILLPGFEDGLTRFIRQDSKKVRQVTNRSK